MRSVKKPIRLLLGLLAAATLTFTLPACSSGTEDGDTNVETGTTKSRNPEKGNPNALNNRDRGSTYEEELESQQDDKYFKDKDETGKSGHYEERGEYLGDTKD